MSLYKKIIIKFKFFIRYLYYFLFKFDKWHLSTYQERFYAKSIVKYINIKTRNQRNNIVEIGCGLGDITRRIRIKKKLGLDEDEKVLKAARLISCLQGKFNIKYEVFVFPTSSFDGLYDVIVMVNWIHNVEPEVLKKKVEEYFFNNLTPNGEIILDTVQDKEYKYNHSITYLTSDMKTQIFRIGEFERNREVYAIRKE